MSAVPPPYQPSWYDRLQAWIEDRVRSPWVAYVLAVLVVAAVLDGIAWLSGFEPFGEFDPYINSGAVYLVIGYAGSEDAAARVPNPDRGRDKRVTSIRGSVVASARQRASIS